MLIKKNTGEILFKRVILRNTLLEKATGLMFRDISKDECMIFRFKKPRIISIHMLFVFYPIDIVYLKNNKVVEIAKNVKPWSFYTSKNEADTFIEFKHRKVKIKVGDVLEWITITNK